MLISKNLDPIDFENWKVIFFKVFKVFSKRDIPNLQYQLKNGMEL